ncbi:hypothetical protein IQ230_13805 [Gloeocapsopsis crepidinum LEGE 06123]|uniref:Uncharacterized protein n=1 Tax=Gloeocapsopsis crepidinum LEGE 06123 TaxID=588587 RepID=A0ABR9USX4_9CHRO|nr:hypothetical protein [Gloeocapsopsis crepidinum]MBE9191401.1 hypothetical protein [Gloeocapsopsis crepidinum LEGE 06123]
MADCSEIYAAIARLERKIDSIPRVNEQAIIQKSVNLSKSALLPEFAKYAPLAAFGAVQSKVNLLGGKVNVLGNSLDGLRYTTNQLGSRVNVASKVANNAKVATDKLGRNVIDQSKKLGELGSKYVKLDQKMGGLLSKINQLGSRLGNLAQRILPLFNLIGAVAGLYALYATLRVVFPRLDAQDRELDAQRQALSDNLSAAHRGINLARAAQRTADDALSRSKQTAYELVGVRASAYAAQQTANDGVATANRARGEATQAQRTADAANSKASDAVNALPAIKSSTATAQRTADAANSKASDAVNALPAIRSSTATAQRTADAALEQISSIRSTAQKASNQAAQALNQQPKTGLTTTPSTGITRSEAELTRFINTTVRQSTGITAEQARAEQIRQQQVVIPQIVNQTIQQSPVIQQIQNTVNIQQPTQNVNAAIQQSPTIQQLQNTIKAQEKVNEVSNQKLDAVSQKIDNLTTINNQQTTLLGSIQDIIKGIQRIINGFVGQINNLVNQFSIVINQINDLINKLNTFIQNVNNQLRSILNYLIAALAILTFMQPLIPIILANTVSIIGRLAAIKTFLEKFAKSIHLDKVLNALTLIVSLHNAAMLSRNLGQTLGDLTSQALTVVGIKDENGGTIDVNEILSKQTNAFFESILGAEVWAGIKTSWIKANNILASASQIMWTVRSLFDSGREILEWTAENTGKIGNALKRFRVVGENAYKWMPERVTATNAWALKVDRMREGIDSLDDAASSLTGVLGEVQNIQSEFGELQEQKQQFENNLKEFTPKDREDNEPVKQAVAAGKIASKAPEGIETVFRGEGESEDAGT